MLNIWYHLTDESSEMTPVVVQGDGVRVLPEGMQHRQFQAEHQRCPASLNSDLFEHLLCGDVLKKTRV